MTPLQVRILHYLRLHSRSDCSAINLAAVMGATVSAIEWAVSALPLSYSAVLFTFRAGCCGLCGASLPVSEDPVAGGVVTCRCWTCDASSTLNAQDVSTWYRVQGALPAIAPPGDLMPDDTFDPLYETVPPPARFCLIRFSTDGAVNAFPSIIVNMDRVVMVRLRYLPAEGVESENWAVTLTLVGGDKTHLYMGPDHALAQTFMRALERTAVGSVVDAAAREPEPEPQVCDPDPLSGLQREIVELFQSLQGPEPTLPAYRLGRFLNVETYAVRYAVQTLPVGFLICLQITRVSPCQCGANIPVKTEPIPGRVVRIPCPCCTTVRVITPGDIHTQYRVTKDFPPASKDPDE